MSTSTKVVTPKFKENQIKTKVKLKLTDEFIAQVKLLHDTIGAIEWSGPLVFKVTKGSIEDIKNFELEAVEIIPMDIGTSTYTEYEFFQGDYYADDKVMTAMEDSNLKIGHCHTHHNMNCFFSGTDTAELHDNAPAYNYYVSLIVNFKDYTNWCGKIAYISKKTIKGSIVEEFKGTDGLIKLEEKTVDTVEEILNLIDLDLVKDEPVVELPQEFKDRVKSLWEEHNKPVKSYTGIGYYGEQQGLFDYEDYHYGRFYNKTTKLKSAKTGRSINLYKGNVPLTEGNIKTFLAQLLSFDKSATNFEDVMKQLTEELDTNDDVAEASKRFILDFYKESFDTEFEDYFGYEPTHKSYIHVSAILGKISLDYVKSSFMDSLLEETRKLTINTLKL